ncbi:Hsp20/alpha crystallin family protein [Aquabacterium sp. A7-Y]|uniref:Hsp20/alpha crystallin family protein n=1 Tax=Aquabacterium sp. A7-Y TaxID=1349605 RepID=UPI00223D38DF|nr:Hsp20/alpha crystallin family protein [Aquabacterium sp. A7-Y]MCW7538159.1 Hsp20/alpha crystallin family protein [Aquabacterium sp. A7-Y]
MFVLPMTRTTAARPDLLRAFDRLLDDGLFSPPAKATRRSAVLDIAETATAYVATVDLPGVAREDIKISVEGRRVELQAEARPAPATEGEPAARVLHRERPEARYARSFTLPADVDQSKAQATLEHGVLTLTLPKLAAAQPIKIQVN